MTTMTKQQQEIVESVMRLMVISLAGSGLTFEEAVSKAAEAAKEILK